MTTRIKLHLVAFRSLLPVVMVILLLSCDPGEETQDHAAAAQGHAHEAVAAIDTTVRTTELEFFVEYPALVVGQVSNFAAHFTWLREHRPVESGKVTVSLVKDQQGVRQMVESPSSPGIFNPAIRPEEAGMHQLYFDLVTSAENIRIGLGQVQVYESVQVAESAMAGDTGDEPPITFLKEQAWKIDFQTVPVNEDTIFNVLNTTGTWMPAPANERTLNAGTEGNVIYALPDLVVGRMVQANEVLMRVTGENLNQGSIEAEVQKARAEYEQSTKAYERKQTLNEMEVVPAAELEEAAKQLEIARVNYQSLLKNYSANGIAIRAPFEGYVKSLMVENGAFVSKGQQLLTFSDDLAHLIRVNVSPAQRFLLDQVRKIWVANIPVSARLVSVGRSVSQASPFLPAFFEVETPPGAIEGNIVEVQLGHTGFHTGLVVPRSALLEDFGTYQVAVQLSGEGFELREVKLGSTNGDLAEITEGLQADEWVVSEGAYQVKMASMAGSAPAHGHAH